MCLQTTDKHDITETGWGGGGGGVIEARIYTSNGRDSKMKMKCVSWTKHFAEYRLFISMHVYTVRQYVCVRVYVCVCVWGGGGGGGGG